MVIKAGDSLIFSSLHKLPKKEERDIPPAIMNIRICSAGETALAGGIFCPGCHTTQCRRHGFYIRRGFHAPNGVWPREVKVIRYRCCNPECDRCTFSVLPPWVLRYCRFLWPYLFMVVRSHERGSTRYHQAKHVWNVGWGVIVRAIAMFSQMKLWIAQLFQELFDGQRQRQVELMARLAIRKLGSIELIARWYRHWYPKRFF